MSILLKLNRAAFALVIAIVNSASTYASLLINFYVGPLIAGPTAAFIAAISSATVVYLGTEEEKTNV